MDRRSALILTLTFALLAGCASQPPNLVFAPDPPPAPTAKSQLTIDQILPPVALPAARPATRPGVAPPVESLALYAAARDALIDNQTLGAVGLLEQAITFDPDSFELYRTLGEAHLAVDKHPTQAELDAFEKALALRPDDLRLQALVGSQYAAMQQADKSLLHLRLALLTHDYAIDEVPAAAVDLLLGHLLQDLGYDRAAEDRYTSLMHRLENPGYSLRVDAEMGPLIDDPQPVLLEIGLLREKRGDWNGALEIYQKLAKADNASFELQEKVVLMLAAAGRTSDAVRQAADIVLRFDASTDSLKLLKAVCSDHKLDPLQTIRRLRQGNASDQSLLLTEAELLSDQGKPKDAESLLAADVQSSAGKFAEKFDRRVVTQLFSLYLHDDDVPSATKLFMAYFAKNPEALGEIESWWEQLLRDSRPNPLSLAMLQGIKVDPSAEAVKAFLVWRLADLWKRDELARTSLQAAVHSPHPFAPAYRQLVAEYWSRSDWTEAQKQHASDALADSAEKAGDAALAYEVRGLASLAEKQPEDAVTYFEQALTNGGDSPELMLTYSRALFESKEDVKAEQLLQKLVVQQPQFDDAWESLFGLYVQRKQTDDSRKVLSQWLAANPASVRARILQSNFAADAGAFDEAEAILLRIFADHDDDPDVISALLAVGQRTGHQDQFIKRLDDLRLREPRNATALEWLVEIYTAQNRTADAIRILGEARAASAKDPDLLYRIAHLYEHVNQSQTTEEVLAQVVKLDPHHASASNDLGYSWADEGKNLDQAETMIRVAVDQEPDNQSFLDSLGWVLYKRGKFDEAASYLTKALAPALEPDPVVLDHFGDTLYRLGRGADAAGLWERSLAGLDQESPDRPDLKALRDHLTEKLQEQKNGQTVSVAPTVAPAAQTGDK